eukprot:1118201-Amphidinium_carterae.1
MRHTAKRHEEMNKVIAPLIPKPALTKTPGKTYADGMGDWEELADAAEEEEDVEDGWHTLHKSKYAVAFPMFVHHHHHHHHHPHRHRHRHRRHHHHHHHDANDSYADADGVMKMTML